MSPSPDRLQELVIRFRRLLSIVGQLLLVVVSNRIAFWMRFDNDVPQWALTSFWQMLPWLLLIRALTFIPFRLYEGLWRYTSVYDLQGLIGGVSISSVLFFAFLRSSFGLATYPRSVVVTDAILLTMILGGIRLTRRVAGEFGHLRSGRRVLIYGAGDAGELIVRDMKSSRKYPYQPVGFVDDDGAKIGRRIHGVPVLGTRRDLPRVLAQYRPAEVLIAMPRANPSAVRAIVRALEPFKIPIKTLPNLRDIIDGRVDVAQIRNLSVDDLLSRPAVGLDTRTLKNLIAGRRVMVTGAGGSIGSELCRQIARLQPGALVMFERYENSLHAIQMELQDRKPAPSVFPVVGDVTDSVRIAEVLARYRPEIIFHAAAHKHLLLMEENPCEAIKNNVRGTRLLAKAADEQGVDRFIFISTDKAVKPTSVMGASKRVCELVVQAQAVGSGTSFSIVRFGNVLGSNGSVVPRFMDQIRRGGPVTITDPEVRRFFMLIPEAVQLVLHAAAQAESGVTYVLEMGEQVKVLDLARDLIRLSGLVPEEDIKIEFIGLRPGEKLYEELVGPDEEAMPSQSPEILCVRSRRPLSPSFLLDVEKLEATAATGHAGAVRVALAELVGPMPVGPSAVSPASESEEPRSATAVAFVQEHEDEQPCPKCTTGRVRRSRVRAIHERVYRQFTDLRLFRCASCGWRGWLQPLQFGGHTAAESVGTIDLSPLDRQPTLHIAPARPAFSPRNLS